mmetsp:Transcript_123108/g.359466  ORF Transcript_123108/g.359466 Transcript_123108/m.359466 type:complete len:213 (+) Transcript_123108:408-1046(+)
MLPGESEQLARFRLTRLRPLIGLRPRCRVCQAQGSKEVSFSRRMRSLLTTFGPVSTDHESGSLPPRVHQRGSGAGLLGSDLSYLADTSSHCQTGSWWAAKCQPSLTLLLRWPGRRRCQPGMASTACIQAKTSMQTATWLLKHLALTLTTTDPASLGPSREPHMHCALIAVFQLVTEATQARVKSLCMLSARLNSSCWICRRKCGLSSRKGQS